MNCIEPDSFVHDDLEDHLHLKTLSCFSQLKNGCFDLILNEKPFSVVCYEVFPRAKGVFENILMMDVLGEEFDLDRVETKWINFCGRFYNPRIDRIEACGKVHKYKIKAIIPESDFWV